MTRDDQRALIAERYGDPAAVAAEQVAPPPAPPPAPPGDPRDTPEQHRKVLLDALYPKAGAA